MNRKFVAKSNYVLRKVLNSEDNVDILREFIEVILNIKIKKAGINQYLEKRKKNLPAEENFGIADLRIQTEDKEELNIGIQMIDGEHVLTKMFLYFAQIHFNQSEYGDNRNLTKTITINSDYIQSNDISDYKEVLDTIIHEGRHAYQYYNLTEREVHPRQGDISNWKANEFKYGYQDARTQGFAAYYLQPQEADARAFAEDVLKQYQEKIA